MQLVLGVAATDTVARLALVDAADPDSVLDRFEVDLPEGSTSELVRTIADTDRSLRTDGFPLSTTSICWPDLAQADTLRTALSSAGVGNVTVVSAADAATGFVRATAGSSGERTSALLLVDDATAALSVVGEDALHTSLIDAEELETTGSFAACTAMIERLREETGGAQTLYVLSTSMDSAALTEQLRGDSPIPVYSAAEPTYLLARGAAMAAAAAAAAAAAPTGMAAAVTSPYVTAPSPAMGQHLAYSMADDSGSMPIGLAEEYDDSAPLQTPMNPLSGATPTSYAEDPREYDGAIDAGAGRPRVLLLGSTIAAVVVVGFAALAVGVAINIKPTVSQQAVRDIEAVPGKYLPPMPGQGVEPVHEVTAYLPPVVPVAATPPSGAGEAAVFTRGNSGTYSTSAGNSGGGSPVIIGGGGAPAGPGVPTPSNPLGGFRLSDWLDLPDTVNVSFPQEFLCGQADPSCVLTVLQGCFPGRPGFEHCLEDAGLISRRSDTNEAPETTCATEPAAANCEPNGKTEQLDTEVTAGDPEDPAVDQPSGSPEGSQDSDSGTEPNTTDGQLDDSTEFDSTNPQSEGETGGPSAEHQPADAPKEGKTSTGVTTPAADSPTSETASEAGPSGTTSPPSEPPPPSEPKITPPSTSAPAREAAPKPEAPPAPKPEAPPTPKPAPPVEAPPPPPVEEPKPVVVEAPAPEPPPVVVEAPAPAPPPVVVPEVQMPDISSDPGSSSSDSGSSSSGSDSSDLFPITTEPSSP